MIHSNLSNLDARKSYAKNHEISLRNLIQDYSRLEAFITILFEGFRNYYASLPVSLVDNGESIINWNFFLACMISHAKKSLSWHRHAIDLGGMSVLKNRDFR